MAEKTPDAPVVEARIIPIEWPDVGVAVYANNLVAQYDGDSVRLVFTQVSPPYLTMKKSEKKKRLDSLKHVKAIRVAELAVPLERFRVMVDML